ncbi:SPASM domain-containing protein [bacterium]|nr:SPASM domain-containing protein [bacterium]
MHFPTVQEQLDIIRKNSVEILSEEELEKIRLQISLDGGKRSHDLNRMMKNGKGSHDIVSRNIALIRHKEKITGLKILHIKGTFTQSSAPINQMMIEFYDKNQLNYSITPATSSPKINDSERITVDEVENQVKEMCNKWFYLLNFDIISENKLIIDAIKTIFLNNIKSRPCSAGIEIIAIGVDGSIYPCHRLFGQKDHVIGDIYNGLNLYSAHLNKYYISASNNKEHCKKCGFLYLCPGSCPAESAINKDTEYIDIVYCVFYSTLFRECLSNIVSLKKNNIDKYNTLIDKLISNNKHDNNKPYSCFEIINQNNNHMLHPEILIFKRKDDIRSIDLGNEALLYRENSGIRYVANATLMVIWSLIDGCITGENIAKKIATICEVPVADIENDIYEQFCTLYDLGFIESIPFE